MRLRRRSLLLLLCLLFLLSAAPALAQVTVSVSGIVLAEDGRTPVDGAAVLLAGQRVATSERGAFIVTGVTPGGYTLAVEALGYTRYTVDLSLRADTTLHILLTPQPVSLEALVARGVTISGTIRDAGTGLRVLGGVVTVQPGDREDGARNGGFSISGVPPGPVVVTARAMEYLPARVELDATHDVTLRFDLLVDSVALRMIQQQVQRIADRAEEMPFSLTEINRDDMEKLGFATAFDALRHYIPHVVPPNPPWPNMCLLLDDSRSSIQITIGLTSELIERIEIFGFRGSAVRIYTKRYVARLMGRTRLLPNAMLEC